MILPTFINELKENLKTSPHFIQIILGPRQVGKTTGIQNFLKTYKSPHLSFSCDEDFHVDHYWLEEKYQLAKELSNHCLLVIDEIQKVTDWSKIVKKWWDIQEKTKKTNIKIVLLGSSSLEIQSGLSESLTGRFQLIQATHWNYELSKKVFNLSFEDYFKFGGYPGAYQFIKNPQKWQQYIKNSIINTVITKDIMTLKTVRKPALFKQCFELLTTLPAKEISLNKLLGQLQDRGNAETVKYYLELLEGAFLFKTLEKYSPSKLRVRSSSPKIIPLCNALIDRSLYEKDSDLGLVFEALVGTQLLKIPGDLFYWRENNIEVDYVLKHETGLYAIEVKYNKPKSTAGLDAFTKKYPKSKVIFVTQNNYLELDRDPTAWLDKVK